MEYSYSQLRVLWHLKMRGPLDSYEVILATAAELGLRENTLLYNLRELEKKSVVLRTFEGRRIVRVELVDPEMVLPPYPGPPPLAAVMAVENEDLLERSAHEPTAEGIINALLERNEQLQAQIDKLQDIVAAQAQQLQAKPKQRDLSHLSQRVQAALSPEQWEQLRHGKH